MCSTFASYAALSGQVPVVGIVSGRCFAGNAALLGCSDVIIATRSSNIGMGGPAMIEGGGLGVFKPEQIGPSRVQHANGVIDVLVEDEARAVAAARHYLSFFQGRTRDWITPDPQACAPWCPRTACACTTRAPPWPGMVDDWQPAGAAHRLWRGIHTALARIEGPPRGPDGQQPAAPGRRHRRRRGRQGARASCSCATRTACPRQPGGHARASWWAPRSKRRPRCAT
jgi:hypothetical protein